jgi:hypothetical protein
MTRERDEKRYDGEGAEDERDEKRDMRETGSSTMTSVMRKRTPIEWASATTL